jgi:hypothetical protein
MIKSLVNWSLFVFSLLIVASALAQPGGKSAPGKILALLEDLEGLVTNVQTDVGAVQTGVGAVQADLGAMQLDVDVIQADVDAMQLDLNAMQHLEVRVGVDEDTCAVAGSRPCQGWGHSFDAASSDLWPFALMEEEDVIFRQTRGKSVTDSTSSTSTQPL